MFSKRLYNFYLPKLVHKHFVTAKNIKNPVVSVREGKLQGSIKSLYNGSPYYSFKGIPYAQPPVGKLRFKAPIPARPWEGIYDATQHRGVCPQYDIFTESYIAGDENCLLLNVYTSSLQPTSKIPVMVFIHGGGYMSGSGNTDMYGPEFLLQHNVVLVTLNYRLEVLGFLSLNTPEVPGNAGLKDQVLALKWVKENIAQFGGDPDNVTIFGESAGGGSVTYHLMSPISRGLFHKAITQSGTCLQDWSIGRDGRERAFRAAKNLGKETDDINELLEFLQSVPALDLARSTMKTMTYEERYRSLPMHFVPVVEKKFDGIEQFITEEPIDVLLKGNVNKVPLMIGFNSAEGLMMLGDSIKKMEFRYKHPQFYVPRDLSERLSQEEQQNFGKQILQFYAGDRNFSKSDKQSITDMQSQIYFVYNVHRFCYFYKKLNVPVYMYRFNYVSELNMLKNFFGHPEVKGASHADDLFYLFSNMSNEDAYKQDKNLRDKVYTVTKLWTNFAKFGNPTPDGDLGFSWLTYTSGNKEYLNIEDTPFVSKYAERSSTEFWNKLYGDVGLPYISKSNI